MNEKLTKTNNFNEDDLIVYQYEYSDNRVYTIHDLHIIEQDILYALAPHFLKIKGTTNNQDSLDFNPIPMYVRHLILIWTEKTEEEVRDIIRNVDVKSIIDKHDDKAFIEYDLLFNVKQKPLITKLLKAAKIKATVYQEDDESVRFIFNIKKNEYHKELFNIIMISKTE